MPCPSLYRAAAGSLAAVSAGYGAAKSAAAHHQFIGASLGIRRASVTQAAQALREAGIISYERGTITVRDRAALEAQACACYRQTKQTFERVSCLR
ncbi:helix-turn-helix domain-containing protein [Vasconcelosia minhoensis]|uniref:helix-turn-helix domain-containing protein n=1 Tax=Vasconcelosia minhoensis TaxID=3366354 RepID=UPI0036F2AE3F